MSSPLVNATVFAVLDEDRYGETHVIVCASAAGALAHARHCIEAYFASSSVAPADVKAALADFDSLASRGELPLGAGDPTCRFYVSVTPTTIV